MWALGTRRWADETKNVPPPAVLFHRTPAGRPGARARRPDDDNDDNNNNNYNDDSNDNDDSDDNDDSNGSKGRPVFTASVIMGSVIMSSVMHGRRPVRFRKPI